MPALPTTIDLVWLIDTSSSMYGQRIAALNQLFIEGIPALRNALVGHPARPLTIRVIRFADDATWHVGPQPVPLATFHWRDLTAGGATATAAALRLLACECTTGTLAERERIPVVILVSDGCCSEPGGEYRAALATLNSKLAGSPHLRAAIALGIGTETGDEQLFDFLDEQPHFYRIDESDRLIARIMQLVLQGVAALVPPQKSAD